MKKKVSVQKETSNIEEKVASKSVAKKQEEEITAAVTNNIGIETAQNSQEEMLPTEIAQFTINPLIKGKGKVQLSWKSLEIVKSGYDIVRTDSKGIEKVLNSVGPNEVKFTDGNPLPGETCTYRVVAFKRANHQKITIAESNICEITAPAPEEFKTKAVNRPVTVRSTLEKIDKMEGHEFESFCADLLRMNGYPKVSVTRGSGDQGLDVIAHRDGIDFGIQCKCYSSDIGNKAVQEAFAGKTFYGCHVAIVLTNRYFTKAAKDLAEINKVVLWDRDKLVEFIKSTGQVL